MVSRLAASGRQAVKRSVGQLTCSLSEALIMLVLITCFAAARYEATFNMGIIAIWL
jgi:hypothetical protein